MSLELTSSERIAQASALRAERARRRGSYPLSSAQLRLWLLDQADPGNPLYNVSRAFALRGPLDVGALERSIAAVVDRHAPLRTTFALVDGSPVQSVRPTTLTALPVEDLSMLAPDQRRGRVERAVTEAAGFRFALDADALLQARLVRIAPDEHVLLLTMHHIAVDDRSLEILYAEVAAGYAAAAVASPNVPAPLPMQYAEYALWEHALRASGAYDAQLDYWKTRLANAPPMLRLPAARQRPRTSRSAGAARRFSLTPAQVAAIHALARDAGATPFMVYLAAFYALLARYSDATDIVVGSPICGRREPQTEAMIGFFANTVALRLDVSGNPPFPDLVTRVRAAVLDAFDQCDVPFDRVVAAVAKERSGNANPIFRVVFAMQPPVESVFTLAGIDVTPMAGPRTSAKFDLTALVFERGTQADVELNYAVDVFDDTTIAALLASFREIFETIAATPRMCLDGLCAKRAAGAPAPIDETPEAGGGDRCETPELRARELELRKIWETLLDVQPIRPGDDFFALGGNSLLAVRLIERIERGLGFRLPMAVFFERPTIEHVARAMIAGAERTALVVLRPPGPGTNGSPVIFFHGDLSGGGCYVRNLAERLGQRPVYVLPPHGCNGGDVPDTIEAMAADRLALLRAAGIEPPYDLVGYCNGALVALELGRRIAAAGSPPPRVVVIDAEVYHPDVVFFTRAAALAGRLLRLDERARDVLVQRLVHRWKCIRSARSPLALLAFARGKLHARRAASGSIAAGAPCQPTLEQRYRERMLRFRPAPYAGRLTVLATTHGAPDRRVHVGGWSRVAPSIDYHVVAGDHLSAVTTQSAALADTLRSCLE